MIDRLLRALGTIGFALLMLATLGAILFSIYVLWVGEALQSVGCCQ